MMPGPTPLPPLRTFAEMDAEGDARVKEILKELGDGDQEEIDAFGEAGQDKDLAGSSYDDAANDATDSTDVAKEAKASGDDDAAAKSSSVKESKLDATSLKKKEMEERYRDKAFRKFADYHGLDLHTVTMRMLEDTEEGFRGWAFKDEQIGGASTINRNMCRMLDRPENKAIKNVVKYLPPSLLAKFRICWEMSKTFDFMEESKDKENYHVSTAGEKKVFMTWKGIAKELGDANDPECQEEAWSWCCGCWNTNNEPEEWYRYSAWLGTYRYGYMMPVSYTGDGEKHTLTTKMYNDMNVWEIAATENKACLNYAKHYGVRPNTVDIADVRATPLGVKVGLKSVIRQSADVRQRKRRRWRRQNRCRMHERKRRRNGCSAHWLKVLETRTLRLATRTRKTRALVISALMLEARLRVKVRRRRKVRQRKGMIRGLSQAPSPTRISTKRWATCLTSSIST